MHYELVFDAVRDGTPPLWSAWVVAVPCVGLGLLWWESHARRVREPGSWQVVAWLLVVVGSLATVQVFDICWLGYLRLAHSLEVGGFDVVEGVVSDFEPLPASGHGRERFRVGAHHYSYSDYEVAAGFHHTQPLGGPIRGGLHVRIRDVNGQIARLEIAHAAD